MVYRDLVFGIDTSCCHGGRLTGIVLPEFRLVSVPSRLDYWKVQEKQYADLRFNITPPDQASWNDSREIAAIADAYGAYGQELLTHARKMRDLLQRGEDAVNTIFQAVAERHEEIIVELGLEGPFDTSTLQSLKNQYADRVGRSPLARYLYSMRQGKLKLETVQKSFPGPWAAIRFARRHLKAVGKDK